MSKSSKSLTSTSKFLSLVLRHQPEVIGMQLDPEGWLPIDELIQNASEQGKILSLELLHEVVASWEKKRFALSEDGLKIRANQGHSVRDVELNLQPSKYVPCPSQPSSSGYAPMHSWDRL